MKEWLIEFSKVWVPVVVLYFHHLKTRTELDILYAKQRGCEMSKMRRRWYHKLYRPRKPQP